MLLFCVRQGFAAKNNGAILPRICYNSCIYLSEVWYYGRIAPYSGKERPHADRGHRGDAGYIRGYETLGDWEQAGVNLVEAVIELRVTPHKARGFDDIGMTIAQFDEVDTVLLMSGSYDLQVIIKGRSFQEIAIFVAKRLSPLDDVLSTATSFVLRPYKRGGRLYLAQEPDETECTVL